MTKTKACGREADMKDPRNPENRIALDGESDAESAGAPRHREEPSPAPADHDRRAARFQSFFENSPEGIVFVDQEGIVLNANRAFCDLVGSRPEEVIGTDVERFYAYSGDRDRFVRKMLERGFVRNFEWKARTKDGTERHFLVASSLQRDPAQNLIGYQSIVHDVSEEKKALEALFHTDRIKALGEMAAAAAHNFRNLLQIMVGGTRLALSNLESGNLPEIKVNLDNVLANLRSAGETARLLSHFSGVRREKTVPIGRIFDLSRTVEKAVEICIPWIEADPERIGIGISLKPALEPGCLVKGVETEFLEVIVNLIWNAAEALRDGGTITVTTHREDEHVVLRVRDDGIGIPKEHLPKVFQPFWTTKGLEGNGLGLASSYGIVCRHGGDITIDSEEAKGTAVSVKLPIPDKSLISATPLRAVQVEPSYRILVVDDLEPLLRILKHGLAKRGQKVLTASSGEEAVKLFVENEFDAVICDLAMPQMSGWQVGIRIIEICRAKGIPKPPFILLTGWGGQVDQVEKIAESGVDAVVEKPMDIPRLLDVVRELVQERRDLGH
jgi:PAS domain S-box-containing protein